MVNDLNIFVFIGYLDALFSNLGYFHVDLKDLYKIYHKMSIFATAYYAQRHRVPLNDRVFTSLSLCD